MVRALLGIVALVGASACGQTERDLPSWATRSGAPGVAGIAGVGSVAWGGAGSGGASAAGASSGGLAGTGGSSALSEAVAECEHYCETLTYKLPTALCEDWHRPQWDPQFCHLVGPFPTCADYCREVYDTVTPECAPTLAPVIRCVSHTYASVSVPTGECWLKDCRDLLFTMTSACYGLQEKLAAARATWAASGIVDYQLQYDLGIDLKAQVVVRAGSDPVVTPADAVAWTVPKLFDAVEGALTQPGVAPDPVYDADLGYVVGWRLLVGCVEGSGGASGIEVTPLNPL
jgi:hypothetical protein